MTVTTPTVPVMIELGSALDGLAEPRHARLLAGTIGADVRDLLERLGLDGVPEVEIAQVDTLRPMRVRVHGEIQPYSPSLMLRAWLAVAPPEERAVPAVSSDRTQGYPADWVRRYAEAVAPADERSWTVLLGFVERLALQAILKRPSCLVGPEQVRTYAQGTRATAGKLETVLLALIDLGVSVADREHVAALLNEAREFGRSPEDTVEALFIELCAHAVEIHVHPLTLRALFPTAALDAPFSIYSLHVDKQRQKLFHDMEQAFIGTFGFVPPRLEWVPSPALPAATFAVRMSAWWGLPTPIVEPGERLVNARVDDLRDIESRPAIDPTNGMVCAIVPDSERAAIEAQGFTTLGPVDFVILNVLAELSRRPSRLLGIEEIEYLLAQLDAAGYDVLVQSALARYSLGDLTRICRSLIEERLSLRNLHGILEILVQFETIEFDANGLEVLDDRLPVHSEEAVVGNVRRRAYYEYLRRHLSAYLSHIHIWHEDTILAYALDERLEQRLRDGARDPLEEREVEAVRDRLWSELLTLSASQFGQTMVTAAGTREAVRTLLSPEFPDLPVVARSELDPRLNIQPLGVIGLP